MEIGIATMITGKACGDEQIEPEIIKEFERNKGKIEDNVNFK